MTEKQSLPSSVYNWKRQKPDSRDYKFAEIPSVKRLKVTTPPPVVNLRKWCSEVENQKSLGSCFTGDTLIPLLNGKIATLKELTDGMYGKTFWVYGNKNGRMVPALASASLTQYIAPIYNVTLDNGRTIKCTADHQFLMRDGNYKKAMELVSGDSLMSFRRKYNKLGYEYVFCHSDHKYHLTHWLVGSYIHDYSVNKNGVEVIHHKDFIKNNNTPENLVGMTIQEHSIYQNKTAECKLKRFIAAKNRWKDITPEAMSRVVDSAEIRLGAVGTRSQIAKTANEVFLKCGNISKEQWETTDVTKRFKFETAMKYFGNQDELLIAAQNYNHKVVSVINSNTSEDVYCLTVPDTQNFALNDGVYVHNCTGQAWVGLMEWHENFMGRGGKAFQNLSRLFVYYNERELEGTINEDAGAELRSGAKALATWGVCYEKSWPYNIDTFTQKPSPICYQDGAIHKINSYYSISTFNHLKMCLANNLPVVFGFMVYSSFDSDVVAKTGIASMPDIKNEELLGGHAAMIVGYNNYEKRFLVRNSWGKNWGLKGINAGYFTLPYDYVANPNLASDFWTVVRIVEDA
jgi:C1A family cysteine protease